MSAPLKAVTLDDDSFRLLAFPFSGPVVSARHPRGVDLEGETFTARTDIKPTWFTERKVDWHHGADPLLKREVIAKAVDLGGFDGPSNEPDEDGWWVTVWMDRSAKHLDLVRRLGAKVPIYGSSESVPGMVKKAANGEILVWPYVRQTLSTSPMNTHSVIRPLKAVLDGTVPTAAFWSEIEAAMRDLGADLRLTSAQGDDGAKAGRVLSAANETDLREAVDTLRAAMKKLDSVVGRQPDYTAGREPA